MAAAKPHCCVYCAAELTATSGDIRRAEWLRIVYFDQTRELDSSVTLRRALAPEGDSVNLPGPGHSRSVMGGTVSCLRANSSISPSNGFRRRTRAMLIAHSLLQPADVFVAG